MLIVHRHQEVMACKGYATKYFTTLIFITLLYPKHYGAQMYEAFCFSGAHMTHSGQETCHMYHWRMGPVAH